VPFILPRKDPAQRTRWKQNLVETVLASSFFGEGVVALVGDWNLNAIEDVMCLKGLAGRARSSLSHEIASCVEHVVWGLGFERCERYVWTSWSCCVFLQPKGWEYHGFRKDWTAVRTGIVKGSSGWTVNFSAIRDLEASRHPAGSSRVVDVCRALWSCGRQFARCLP
jgi:hypothetical protein